MPLPLPDVYGPIVDVSGNNKNVDLDAAKAGGITTVFLKATEGATWKDVTLPARMAKAKALGLRIGVYHYGTAMPAAAQVKNFVDTVSAAAGDFSGLLPILDVERNADNTMTADNAEAWLALFNAQQKRQPVVYAGDYLQSQGGAKGHPTMLASPLWLAAYVNPPAKPIDGWAKWSLWQFTDGLQGPFPGKVPGIGACDQSVFNGAQADFDAFWKPYA
jgi:lysozyme